MWLCQRLTHLLSFQETKDLYIILITVALNQLKGFSNLFHLFSQVILVKPELLHTRSHPGKGHCTTCHRIARCSESHPEISLTN